MCGEICSMKKSIEEYKKRKLEEHASRSNTSTTSTIDSSPQISTNLTQQQQKKAKKVIPIVFKCREGSITHYFHFFYGAMIPLIEYHLSINNTSTNTSNNNNNEQKVFHIVSDVGPFKGTLAELNVNIVSFEGPDLTVSNIIHDDKSLRREPQEGEVILPAYDLFNSDFFHDSFLRSKLKLSTMKNVFEYFQQTIPPYISLFPVYDIVIIQRSTDRYYSQGCSNRQEIYQTSGEIRRKIVNHVELVNQLQLLYPGRVVNVVLERSSIYFQCHLFHSAKIVIAQHGAALSNIFFMQNNPNSHVIEIMTPWGETGNHFCHVAEFFQVGYHCVRLRKEHDEVDIEQVCQIVNNIIPAAQSQSHSQSQSNIEGNIAEEIATNS